jgi:protein involved in polysaccharide export with SLBB domain
VLRLRLFGEAKPYAAGPADVIHILTAAGNLVRSRVFVMGQGLRPTRQSMRNKSRLTRKEALGCAGGMAMEG